jgi:tetratricopeptide (TPR) repeat protein
VKLPPRAVERLLAAAAKTEPADPPDLGRYRLIRELGRGGMGRVFEAHDTQLDRRVALKLMPETAGLSEVLRRRFVREALAAAKLSHPHIAAVYEATPDFIAMQFVDGCALSDLPRDRPRRIVALVRDAALAVQCAHDAGIVHRDLKPSNLMVEGADSDQPRVVVLDFGLAKQGAGDSSLSLTGSILGTPAYMAPEQAEGRNAEVDARSDVYGLGATLYACLTGAPPFEANDMLELLRKVVDEDARRPGIDADLDAVVLKCLAKESERRYASAAELAGDLDRWLRGELVRARPPSLRYRAARFFARRKALVRAAALATALSLTIAAAILVPRWLQEAAARRAAQRAVELALDSEVALGNARVLLRTGERADAHARLDETIAQWREFLAEHDTADGHYMLGRLLRARGKREAARAAFDAAIALRTDHEGARFERALLLLAEHRLVAALGDASGARERLRALAEADLRHLRDESRLRVADLRYALAERRRLQGDLAGARDDLLEVLALEPDHDDAKLTLAWVYATLGDFENAARHGSGAQFSTLGIARGIATGWLTRARTAQESPATAEATTPVAVAPVALATLEERVLGPAVPAGLRAAAAGARDVATARAAWEDAERELDALLRQDAARADALNNRGICRGRLEAFLLADSRTLEAVAMHRAALADYDAAAQRAPESPVPVFNRAILRTRQAERLEGLGRLRSASGELERATADLDRAQALGLDEPELHYQRGSARARHASLLRLEGRLDVAARERTAAIADLEAALRAAPEEWPRREACRERLAAARAPER